jgi:hypothetical protein
MTLWEFAHFFPKFFRGVFSGFHFQLRIGVKFGKGVFDVLKKKALFQITGCPTYGPLLHEAKI